MNRLEEKFEDWVGACLFECGDAIEEFLFDHIRPALECDCASILILDEVVEHVEVIRPRVERRVNNDEVIDLVSADPLDFLEYTVRVYEHLSADIVLRLFVLTESAAKLTAA